MFSLAVVACSSSDDTANGTPSETTKTDGGGSSDAAPDRKANNVDPTPADPQEERTVGNECKTTADCQVADSLNDNICSTEAYGGNDIFSTPVCVQPSCTVKGTDVTDLLCDGEAGYCYTRGGGGVCLPYCQFDSTSITTACQGNNKCVFDNGYVDKTRGAIGIGFCYGMCTTDADCKGTGQACQVSSGECVAASNVVAPTKKPGDPCTAPATATDPRECACNAIGGSGPDKAKGICRAPCATGAEGDATCGVTTTNGHAWKCTALLPAENGGTKLFTGEPAGLRGSCAQPCDTDTDCTFAVGSVSEKCLAAAGGKFCLFPSQN
ncbi:hypothetical protein AKJ09_11442 [Labilithrix luteola]|uniref:Uncharacterized protein n=1 Tax=Labilithrix luteola TaxID=1391654 RepID=A0A0K1QG92_9BACT|nr:hypothetical protein AKJ09_11442 [Labilithrix luteola]